MPYVYIRNPNNEHRQKERNNGRNIYLEEEEGRNIYSIDIYFTPELTYNLDKGIKEINQKHRCTS